MLLQRLGVFDIMILIYSLYQKKKSTSSEGSQGNLMEYQFGRRLRNGKKILPQEKTLYSWIYHQMLRTFPCA
jgi:hypothetical protein